jgi:hypothetical protein
MTLDDSSAAFAAARAVAAAHGIGCDHAAVIAAGSNVLVHMRPASVIARVMTGTAALHEDIAQWLEREVAVGVFVAARGGPVVPPSRLLAPGPYQRDGFWMTFWQFVEHDTSEPPPNASEVGRSLRQLHAVLADFSGELESLGAMRDDIEGQLFELRPRDWLTGQVIDLLHSELQRLAPLVFETFLPAQPLHGDASLSNLLGTRTRLLWNDLEDVCTGPVAWDIAGLVDSARAGDQSEQYVDEMLRAYDGPDLEELQPFIAAHALFAAVWQTFQAQRGPRARTHAPSRLTQWRKQFGG